MDDQQPLLTPEVIQMLVASITQRGQTELTELEAERLLNAIARVQAGVPTGPRATLDQDKPGKT